MLNWEGVVAVDQQELDSLMGRAAQLLEYMGVFEAAEVLMDSGHPAELVFLAIQAGDILATARR